MKRTLEDKTVMRLAPEKIKGLSTTLIVTRRFGKNGFKVTSVHTFPGVAVATYFPCLHGNKKGTDEEKKITSSCDVTPSALSEYLNRNFGGNLEQSATTKFASYMYDLAAPGAFCLFIWHLANEKSGQMLDNYFAKRKLDIAGEYLYGKQYNTLSDDERKSFDWIWQV